MFFEIMILTGLVMANGLLALAEIAIVSARRGHLRKLAAMGNAKAAAALMLAESPTRFLSTVQLGISLIAIGTGAYTGATIGHRLADVIAPLPFVGERALPIAMSIVISVITVLSLVFGELVPKRIALSRPERVALAAARPMVLLTRLGGPLVSLLSGAVDAILGLFHLGRAESSKVSDEEVSMLIEQGFSEGVFHPAEKRMVEGVMALDRLPVTAIMNPRPKIVWLDVEDPDEVNWRKIVTSGHSYFPVLRGSPDHLLGMVSVKALWANSAAGFPTPMRDLLTTPLFVPETLTCIQALETFKRSGRHLALVTDEFGIVAGIVTLVDVLEAIVGDLPARGHTTDVGAQQRHDGSWLIDATLPWDEVKKTLGGITLADDERTDFQTLAGFMMTNLGRMPKAGDAFDAGGFRWEVVDMDQFRIDKVLVASLAPAARTPAANETPDR